MKIERLIEVTDRLGYEEDLQDVTVSDDLEHRVQYLNDFHVRPDTDPRADGFGRKCGGCNYWFDLRKEGIDQPDPFCIENIVLCDRCREW